MEKRGPYQEKEITPDDKRSPGAEPPSEIKSKLAAKLEEIKERVAREKEERKARLAAAAENSTIPTIIAPPLSEAEEIARIKAGLPAIPTQSPRDETIAWLLAHGLAPLPVAPAFPASEYARANGKQKFNGKNPSHLDAEGRPQIINHKQYQDRLPTPEELKVWFENPLTGVGTLGTDKIQFIDLDRKNYDTQEEIDSAAREIFEKLGGEGLLEQTRSGGWRIAIASDISGCQIADATNRHRGELLGKGLFAVLSPTQGYTLHARSAKIPEITSLQDLNIVPAANPPTKTKEKPAAPPTKTSQEKPLARPRRYQKPESGLDPYGRFPAECWSHFGAPLTLWMIARHFDPQGRGWVELNMAAIEKLTNRKESTIRLWLKKGRDMGLFRFTSTVSTQSVRRARIKVYYASMAKIGALAGLETIGTLSLIDFEEDIKNLRIKATEAIAANLQKASRHAADFKERAIAEEMGREPIRTAKPEEICQPCTNQLARVLWRSFWACFVSEGFVAYGASQEKIGTVRKLSDRQVRRHLSDSYRSDLSPVCGYRGLKKKISKTQIHQRLKSSTDSKFVEILDDGKFYLDSELRVWERKCNVYVLKNQLIKPQPHHHPQVGMSDKN